MKFNSGHKIMITVSLLSVLALFIVGLIIVPTVRNIKVTSNETYELRVYMEKKYQESLRSRLTKKKIDDIREESINYDSYLFKKTDALKLIQHLETISQQIKVNQKINSTNLDQIQPGGKLQINITVNGSYLDVLEYINVMENTKYFFNIESLRIIPNHDSSESVSSDATAYLILGLYVSK